MGADDTDKRQGFQFDSPKLREGKLTKPSLHEFGRSQENSSRKGRKGRQGREAMRLKTLKWSGDARRKGLRLQQPRAVHIFAVLRVLGVLCVRLDRLGMWNNLENIQIVSMAPLSPFSPVQTCFLQETLRFDLLVAMDKTKNFASHPRHPRSRVFTMSKCNPVPSCDPVKKTSGSIPRAS